MIRLRSRLALSVFLSLGLAGSGLLLHAQLTQPTGTWVPAGIADGRSNAAVVVLGDGRTLIAGGRLADGTPTESVVIYDPTSGSTSSAGQLLIPRVGAAAAQLNPATVVITGGRMGEALTADVEVLSLATGTSSLVGAMAEPRADHAMARLPNGRVLIVGGATVGGAALGTAEVFDPANNSVTPAGSLTTARIGASATTLIDGRVLIAGGRTATPELRTAEIYDPVAPSPFTPVPTLMSMGRAGHTAVLLPHNAGVLIAGGTSSGSPVASSDLFLPAIFPDPFSYGVGSFAVTGSMNAPRTNAFAGPAGDGGYAFVSGGGGTARELYRYATIKTDKDDYAPGERAIITGSGWQPNEEVHLLFQEDPAIHEDYELTVVADGAGNIRWDQWAPEQHDLGVRFYLMATGSMSRAQTTFTDSNPSTVTVGAQGTNPVTAGGSTTFPIQVIYTGNVQPCTVTLSAVPVTVGFPAWPSPPVGGFFSFSPNSVSASGGETRSSTLTINTPVGMTGNTYRFRVIATHAPVAGDTCNGSGTSVEANLVVVSSASAPVITEGASITVSMTEDSAPTPFSLTLHATDANSDPLTWTISTPAGRGTAATTPGAGTSNVISYTPHPNYNGIDVFEVQVSDGSLTDTITVNVNIAAVNDEPSFTASNQTVNEDAGPQSITSWAAFDPGGESDEDGQTAIYTVSGVSNPTLFSAAPLVAPNGTLTFTTTSNASGSSSFNVVVQDSGGTANGGDNTSATQTFTITVNSVNDAPADLSVSLTSASILEGGSTSVSGTFSDVEATDAHTVVINWGDGGPTATISLPAGTFSIPATAHTYADDNPTNTASDLYTINVTVTDNGQPPLSVSTTTGVTVSNVAPVVTLPTFDPVSPVNEGTDVTVRATFTDPGAADTHTCSVEFGDGHSGPGTVEEPVGATPGKCTAVHEYEDGPSTFVVKVTVTDDDLGAGNSPTASLVVNNVAPTISVAGLDSVNEGSLYSLNLGPVIDPGDDTATVTINWGDLTAVETFAGPSAAVTKTHTYADGPNNYTITVTLTDEDGTFPGGTKQVTVNNVAPTVSLSGSNSANEGTSVHYTFSASDPGADTISVLNQSCGANGTLSNPAFNGTTREGSFDCTFPDGPAMSSVSVQVQDSDGAPSNTPYISVNIVNVAATVAAPSLNPASPVNEGSAVSVTATFSDPGADAHTCTVNFGDGHSATGTVIESVGNPTNGTCSASHTYEDDSGSGTFTVVVSVIDDVVAGYSSAALDVNNVAPTLSITGPADGALYPVGSNVSLLLPFTDPGSSDTHTCIINWDDPVGSADVSYPAAQTPTRNCNTNRIFNQAGVYTILVKVSDDDLGTSQTVTVMIIVYDPSAGFVTGGGTIWSPAGAYMANTTLEGKANFGFVSKYQRGAKTPSGQTEFQFKAGDLNFHGDVYQWLVVSGAKAQYKGTGTLNGVPGYGFLLTATDGQLLGGNTPDRFRIKIVDPNGTTVVYDNVPTSLSDDIDASGQQNIQTGSIVIHTGK